MTRPAPAERLLTIEEYARLPDDDLWRDELVRGRVVREPRPGEEHGWLQLRLGRALAEHAEARALGAVLTDVGVVLSTDPGTVRGPDIAFIARDRLPPGFPSRGFARTIPDLVVEIVSPSSTASEILEKVLEYLDAGVRLVWVVDPRTRMVTAYRTPSDIRLLREGDELDGGEVLPGFRLALSRLFALGG